MRNFTYLLNLLVLLLLPQAVMAQVSLPYSQAFDNEQAFKTFTVIDGNGDGTTWAYDDLNYQAACNRNSSASADDWLVSPKFHFVKGVKYELKFSAKTVQDGTTEHFLVKLGTSATDTTSFSQTLIGDGSADNSYSAKNYSASFTVAEDGDYYLGFHYLTPRQTYSSGLGIDDINLTGSVEETKSSPKAVSGVTLKYDYSGGLTTLKWKAPTQFEDGTDISSPLTYAVRRVGSTDYLVNGYQGTTFHEQVTLRDMPASSVKFGQALLRYAITATCDSMTSAVAYSPFKVVGTPDELPYSETFSDGTIHHFWGESHTGHGRWGEMAVSNKYTHDSDGGVFNFTAAANDESSLGFSGLISLKGASNPVLSFWYEYMNSNEEQADTLEVQVSKNGGEFTTLTLVDVNSEDNLRSWQHAEVSLADYAGSDFIQVGFLIKSHTGTTCIYLDDVDIYNQVGKDLAVTDVSHPGRLRTDESRKSVVKVENVGADAVAGSSYTVAVKANGRTIGQAEGRDLAGGSSVEIEIPVTAPVVLNSDSVDYYAEVDFDGDENLTNNSSDTIRMAVALPSLPRPNNFVAVAATDGIQLSWQQPDAPRATSTAVTDSFESAPDFTISDWGDWTLFDGSKVGVYGVSSCDFPNNGAPQAFTVFNPTAAGASDSWKAHTGNKELVSFSAVGLRSDHWLISPTLSGEAQTLKFYARAYSKSYEEDFEVLTSTSSVDISDFQSLASVQIKKDNAWKEYSYDLPAGTRYFAVRVTSEDAFALLFDDFTFVPDSTGAQNVVLTGYNVYRDGENIAALPSTSVNFTDASAGTGKHIYNVSAVYDKGESVLSDSQTADIADGITVVNTEKADNGQTYDLQGRCVRNVNVPGVYIRNGKKFVVK